MVIDDESVKHDENGDPVPVPSQDTAVGEAVAAIQQLMEWARKRGYSIGPEVQVGDVVLRIRDLRQSADAKAKSKETDIWKEHGLDDEA